MFVDVLLNVLAIIGIIIAGGFLIFFLGDLVISIVDGKNSIIFGGKNNKEKNENERPLIRENLNTAEQHQVVSPFPQVKNEDSSKGILEVGGKEKSEIFSSSNWQDIDEEQAKIEKMMLENSNSTDKSSIENLRKEEEEFKKKRLEEAEKRKTESIFPKQVAKENKVDEDLDFGDLFFDETKNEQTDDDNVDFEALLAELTSKSEKNALAKEEEKLAEKKSEENLILNEVLEEENEAEEAQISSSEIAKKIENDIEKQKIIFSEANNLMVANEQQKDEEIVVAQEDDEKTKQIKAFELEKEKIIEELESLKEILANKERENEELKTKASEELEQTKSDILVLKDELEKAKQEEKVVVEKGPTLSEEEYLNLIEKTTIRLKANEKELKSVKREFLPLARVKKSLDNDKRKLRRKEATVAKQKVVLYGVNNYVDIDEEKAKQLAEDLDLLDGLKLSVEHCESVMEQNKERYPLLENTFRILKNTNESLKNDLEELNAQLAKLRDDSNN
ncbi:MAG: hypothetical protein WCR30_02135 [Clostridia bacterium]